MHQGIKGNANSKARLCTWQMTVYLDIMSLTENRWIWANVAVAASGMTINMIYNNIVGPANQILPLVNCTVGAGIQPITKNHLQAARDLGGDAIDLDPTKGDFVSRCTYSPD